MSGGVNDAASRRAGGVEKAATAGAPNLRAGADDSAFERIDDEAGVRRCHPLMAQLRPHLASADEFLARWRRQAVQGYRLMALREGAHIVALAGYRQQDNLIHGSFLYIDDLVTDAALRGGGHGARLIERMRQEAQALGCGRLVLDTAMSNSLAQRFYFRSGMLATALRFTMPLDGPTSTDGATTTAPTTAEPTAATTASEVSA